MKCFLVRSAVFLTLAAALQTVVSLDWAQGANSGGSSALIDLGGISVGLPATNSYRPDPEILHFQSMMTTHPSLGFLFRPNLGQTNGSEAAQGDKKAWTVTTDESGFFNLPEAIAMRRKGREIDIAAVGSSFTQGAAGTMYKYFSARDLLYYSLGNPRHTFPQFTVAARDFAVPLRPRWLVYEVNEPGFSLIEDYERWAASGMDWFAYHSGTWCGPPAVGEQSWLSQHPTLFALYRGMAKQMGLDTRPAQQTSKEAAVAKAFEYVRAAREAARQQGIGFLVVLIPSRERATKGESARWDWVESLERRLHENAIDTLNLASVFDEDADPRRLYLRVDAHWNDAGMTLAAKAILQRLKLDRRVPDLPTSMR